MKKFTAMLTILSVAVFSLVGCSGKEDEPSSSGFSMESEVFTTTATITSEETTSAEEKIEPKTAPTVPELIAGVLNAIGSHNEEEYNSYISTKNINNQWYGYKAVHGQFERALYDLGLDLKATYTYKDFTAIQFKADGGCLYYIYFTDYPDKIRFYTSDGIYRFNIDTEEYSLCGIKFDKPSKGDYQKMLEATDPDYVYSKEHPEVGYSLVDLSAYATEEVTE